MSKNIDPDFPDQKELEGLVANALQLAQQKGASMAEAGMSFASGLNVTVRLGEVETLEYNRDRSLGITVFHGQHKGSASTSDWSDKALKDTVEAACAIAKHTGEDPHAGLADVDRLATNFPDLDLSHPWDVTAEQAIELAKECEDVARSDKQISNSEGATVSTRTGLSVYGNTHGFLNGYAGTRHSMSCSLIAEDDAGMQRDYWYSIARDVTELETAEMIGKKAAQRTLSRLNSRRLKTGQVPVIFQAEVATGLFQHLISAISGGNLYRQSSFLLDHLGKKLFPEFINIQEQPHLRKALGSASYDSEGVATQPRFIIKNGVLEGYVLSSYSARKLGMETTGNAGGVHNLQVQSGEHNLQGLLSTMDSGLLVTELMGQGINIVTGDYSRGAAGFWVEHGEIQYPVDEITIAGNLKDMFKQIVHVGNDIDKRGNIQTGSVLVENMMLAGE
ncbi:MAG: metalloprotease PmbA [Gammaproteobacteria bacterium]|nr:metalloprotease PmbA [Gammaproteobacteria bacterium]